MTTISHFKGGITLKAIIMDCKDTNAWYANKIGKVYKILDINKENIRVKADNSCKIVRKDDCQILL